MHGKNGSDKSEYKIKTKQNWCENGKHCFVYSFYISGLVFPFKRPIQTAGMESYFLTQVENINSWLQALNAMLQSVFVQASSVMLDWCV